MLVDAFLEITGAEVVEADGACCWSEPPPTIPWQRDEGAFADVISHLDNPAKCWPTRKAWDELVCLPPSAVPCSPHQSRHLGYIQGWVVELGQVLPSMQFHISQPNGDFVCMARGCSSRATLWLMTPPAMRWSWFPCGTQLRTSPKQRRPPRGS